MESDVAIPGYSFGKRESTSPDAVVYRATRSEDEQQVLVKLFSSASSEAGIARREFDALRACAHPSIPRALALDTLGQRHALILEWIDGETLRSWSYDPSALPTADILSIALQLSEALEAIHTAGYVHQAITPTNVIVSADEAKAWLIDFGSAVEFGRLRPSTQQSSAERAGNLAYVPPEQTGWIERSSDRRSDLYALGATFYRAVTGSRPFRRSDRAALIRAILTEPPTPPHELEASIPVALSRMILRLMHKEPSERYQTAEALATDCRELLEQYESRGEIDAAFRLDVREVPSGPSFPSELYGREPEIDRLTDACIRARGELPHLVLLYGAPGVGKSSVLRELRLRLIRNGIHVSLGRFRRRGRRPHAGLADALESLVTSILLAPDARLERFRVQLRTALGPLAQLLIELVPDLEAILGYSPRLPGTTGHDVQERLALAVERFLETFVHLEKHLILLLDDFEESDAGTRRILDRLASSPQLTGLVLVLSINREKLTTHREIAEFTQQCESRGASLASIELDALSPEVARRWLEDTLGASAQEIDELLPRIEAATDRLPLLMREFVLNLHARGCLRYHDGAWHCDGQVLRSVPASDGSASLLAAKLENLDAPTRSTLETASCIDVEFDAELLEAISGESTQRLRSILVHLQSAGYLIHGESGYRFAHRDIRNAAHLGSHPEARACAYRRVAEYLLEQTPQEERAERVFDIVFHLNRAVTALTPELRQRKVELNLEAASQLIASGAGADAVEYLRAADAALASDAWRTQHELAFEIQLKWADASTQQLELEDARQRLQALDLQNPTEDERLQISLRRLGIHAVARQHSEGGRYALEILRSVGIHWPIRPSLIRTRFALWRVGRLLDAHPAEKLFEASLAGNRERVVQLLVLRHAAGLLTQTHPGLGCLTACKVMSDFIRFGYVENPAAALTGVAFWSWRFERNRTRVQRYIESIRYWIAQAPDSFIAAHAEMQLDGVLMAWLGSRRTAIPRLKELHERMLKFGHLEYAHASLIFAGMYAALGGEPIEPTSRELCRLNQRFERGAVHATGLGRIARAYGTLGAESVDPRELRETVHEDDRFIRDSRSLSETGLRAIWMMVLCVHNQFHEVLAQWGPLRGRLMRLSHAPHLVDIWFYRGIAAAQLALETHGPKRIRFVRELRSAVREVRKAAVHGPDFVPMRLLLEAEYARTRRRGGVMRTLYKDAVSRASELRFSHLAALGSERWAQAARSEGRESEAQSLLEQAIGYYLQWGALAKVKLLEAERDEPN